MGRARAPMTSTIPRAPRQRDRGAVVVRNVGLNFLSQFWFAAISIVSLPYIVHSLGATLFGVYVLVSAILGYFAFLDFGMGDALTKYVAEYDAAGDQGAVSRTLQTGFATY